MDQQQLSAVLEHHGIDACSLAPLFTSTQTRVYCLSVPGAAAVALWQALRSVVDATGYWPVLLVGEEDLEEYDEETWDEQGDSPLDIIVAALSLDAAAWVRERLAAAGRTPEVGPWPDDVMPATTFTIPYDLPTWTPLPVVYVALVPTREGWQAPAFLRYGAWNACPHPEEHVCLMKHWAERYDAEPLGMARDRVEMSVARPPHGRATALALAAEQYAYCSDIVDQGTETLSALAAGLMDGTAWFFWWD